MRPALHAAGQSGYSGHPTSNVRVADATWALRHPTRSVHRSCSCRIPSAPRGRQQRKYGRRLGSWRRDRSTPAADQGVGVVRGRLERIAVRTAGPGRPWGRPDRDLPCLPCRPSRPTCRRAPVGPGSPAHPWDRAALSGRGSRPHPALPRRRARRTVLGHAACPAARAPRWHPSCRPCPLALRAGRSGRSGGHAHPVDEVVHGLGGVRRPRSRERAWPWLRAGARSRRTRARSRAR